MQTRVPRDTRGPPPRLPVLRVDLYGSKTIYLQSRLLILTTRVRGIVENGELTASNARTCSPVSSEVSGEVSDMSDDEENGPFQGQCMCTPYISQRV